MAIPRKKSKFDDGIEKEISEWRMNLKISGTRVQKMYWSVLHGVSAAFTGMKYFQT
jgi:hypothetical protein